MSSETRVQPCGHRHSQVRRPLHHAKSFLRPLSRPGLRLAHRRPEAATTLLSGPVNRVGLFWCLCYQCLQGVSVVSAASCSLSALRCMHGAVPVPSSSAFPAARSHPCGCTPLRLSRLTAAGAAGEAVAHRRPCGRVLPLLSGRCLGAPSPCPWAGGQLLSKARVRVRPSGDLRRRRWLHALPSAASPFSALGCPRGRAVTAHAFP